MPNLYEPGRPCSTPGSTGGALARTRTLCLTDVVDSTALASTLGAARNGVLWDAHDTLARALVAEWRVARAAVHTGEVVVLANPAEHVARRQAWRSTAWRSPSSPA